MGTEQRIDNQVNNLEYEINEYKVKREELSLLNMIYLIM